LVKGIFVTYFSVFYEIVIGSPKKLFRVIDQTGERDSAKENAPNCVMSRKNATHTYMISQISIMFSLHRAANGNRNGSSHSYSS
jgi:uncharacterized protein (DUF1499 family)